MISQFVALAIGIVLGVITYGAWQRLIQPADADGSDADDGDDDSAAAVIGVAGDAAAAAAAIDGGGDSGGVITESTSATPAIDPLLCHCGHAEAAHEAIRFGKWRCVACVVTPSTPPWRSCGGYYSPIGATGSRCICGHAAHAGQRCADRTCACTTYTHAFVSTVPAAAFLRLYREQRRAALLCACKHVGGYHDATGTCGAFAACGCRELDTTWLLGAQRRADALALCDFRERIGRWIGQRYADTRVTADDFAAVDTAALADLGGTIDCPVCEAPPTRDCDAAVHDGALSAKDPATARIAQAIVVAYIDAGEAVPWPWQHMAALTPAPHVRVDEFEAPRCPRGFTYSRLRRADAPPRRADAPSFDPAAYVDRIRCDGPCHCVLAQASIVHTETDMEYSAEEGIIE